MLSVFNISLLKTPIIISGVPDPLDPHVFGPQGPETGSISQSLRGDPDPDPDPSISKNSKKNLDSYCFVTSFGLFYL
jgi:hypothetical protein